MSACENIQAELSAYLDGELQEAERAACETHIRECESCRTILEDLKAASAAVSGLPRLKAPPALAVRLRQEVLAHPAPRDFSKFDQASAPLPITDFSIWRPVLVGVAALVILCVMGFMILPAISVPPSLRSASVGDSRRKGTPPAAPTALARGPERSKAKGTSAEATDKLAAPGTAAEALHLADDAAAKSKAEAAAPEAADKDEGLRGKEPAPPAPPPPVAAQPAPPSAPAPSAPFRPKLAETVSKPPAPGRVLDGVNMKRGAGAPQEKVAEKGPAFGRGGDALKAPAQAGEAAVLEEENVAPKKRAAGALMGNDGKLANTVVTPPAGAQGQSSAKQGDLALDHDETLAASQQRPRRELAHRENEELAKEGQGDEPAKPSGIGGGERLIKKGAPAAKVVAEKPAEPEANPLNGNGAAARKQKPEVAVAQEPPAAQAQTATASEAKLRNAFGQAKGGGGAVQRAEPEEVLVFRTQDPERLISQLKALAAQNGARWEVAEAPADRQSTAGIVKEEGKQSQSGADKDGRAGRVDCAIVTAAGQQRRDVLAKLRELQAVSLGETRDLRRRSVEMSQPPSVEDGLSGGAAPSTPRAQRDPSPTLEKSLGAQQELKPAEAPRFDGGSLTGRKVAPTAAPQAQQQSERLEARIPIRIEMISAK